MLPLGVGKVRLGVGGPLRLRHARLSEPGDIDDEHSSPPRWSVAHLGEPIRLDEGRLPLGGPTMVQGLCLWPVLGRSCGPICDCYGLLWGQLCDCWSVSLLK